MNPFDSTYANQIAALLAVFDEGSFVLAGETLQRHPSIISKRVGELEDRLGVRLLERNTRHLRFTEAGRAYVERVRVAGEAIRDAEDALRSGVGSPSGTLRIAAPGAFGRVWLAPVIASFSMQHPQLNVHVDYAESYVGIIEGGYDAAIRIGELEDSRLVATRLCKHERILAAAPGYLKRHGIPATPGDLRTHHCLGFTELRHYPFCHFQKKNKVERIRITARITSNDNEALLSAALAGAGILLGGDWLTSTALDSRLLVRVLPDWQLDAQSAIYFVRPSKSHVPAKTKAFKGWIERHLFAQPPWVPQTHPAKGT